jgi:DNA modification methylase
MLAQFTPRELTELLPETEATLEQQLRAYRPQEAELALEPAPEQPRSKPGELYELGPHRLLCGDATNPKQVALLMGGERAALLATDPPYGVNLDHGWRDGVRQPAGSARAGQLANDDRADWTEAYLLTDAPVAYVWYGALRAPVVWASLAAAGFEVRAEIIWKKTIHVLSRGAYQWAHEPCLYAVRKGCSANWQGGRKQTTVWEAASPIMPFGGKNARGDEATPHPTQKPLELFRRPILNHTQPGDVVYDPFLGSGSCLIAAEESGRRCFGIELDPRWCDLIRERYEQYLAQKNSGRR